MPASSIPTRMSLCISGKGSPSGTSPRLRATPNWREMLAPAPRCALAVARAWQGRHPARRSSVARLAGDTECETALADRLKPGYPADLPPMSSSNCR